jgi:hypothetical protein
MVLEGFADEGLGGGRGAHRMILSGCDHLRWGPPQRTRGRLAWGPWFTDHFTRRGGDVNWMGHHLRWGPPRPLHGADARFSLAAGFHPRSLRRGGRGNGAPST